MGLELTKAAGKNHNVCKNTVIQVLIYMHVALFKGLELFGDTWLTKKTDVGLLEFRHVSKTERSTHYHH